MSNNVFILVIFLIIKMIFIIALPIYIFVYRNKKSDTLNRLFLLDVSVLFIFIILLLFKNSLMINSTFSGIKKVNNINKSIITYETADPNVVEKIITDQIYKNNVNKNVYYFNHNDIPLSNKKFNCEDKELYMKNYGNNITAFSIAVSSALEKNIDPIEILNSTLTSSKYEVLNCDTGFNTNNLIGLIRAKYNLDIFDIYPSEITNYIKEGGIVVAELDRKSDKNTISCDSGYIVIYSVNKEDSFSILNPNDKEYDYICPDNTSNFGKIIKGNSNDKLYSLDELNDMSIRYIAVERK